MAKRPPSSMTDCFPQSRSPEQRVGATLRRTGPGNSIVAAVTPSQIANAQFRNRPLPAAELNARSRRAELDATAVIMPDVIGRTPAGAPTMLIAQDAGQPGELGQIVGRIKFGVGELAENLAMLIAALGDVAQPVTLVGSYSTGSAIGVATMTTTGINGRTLIAYALRDTTTGLSSSRKLNVDAAGRTVTHGAIYAEGVRIAAGVGPRSFPRPIYLPDTSQAVVTTSAPSGTLTAGWAALDGFAVRPEIAEMIRKLVGSLTVYELLASATQPTVITAIKAGPFEPQRVFGSSVAADATTLRLYLGRDNPQSFPLNLDPSTFQITSAYNPLVMGGQRLQVTDQLRAETLGLSGGALQSVFVQGGEYV